MMIDDDLLTYLLTDVTTYLVKWVDGSCGESHGTDVSLSIFVNLYVRFSILNSAKSHHQRQLHYSVSAFFQKMSANSAAADVVA